MPSIEATLSEASRRLQTVTQSPRLDAEILLSMVLERARSHLRAWPEKRLTPEQQQHFETLLQQRLSGIPVAYLTGRREFWSREFEVNPDVLIPRPDTELLIERALIRIPEAGPCRLLDLGTGSGIIAVTLAAERPLADVTATDVSTEALTIARRNAEQQLPGRISFIESDWFEKLPTDACFHLIVSNPPYIADDDPHLGQGDVRFEPRHALIAANRGLRAIETIADQARRHLLKPGHLLVEHGYDQQQPVQRLFKTLGYQAVTTHRDLSGHPRVTYGQWRP